MYKFKIKQRTSIALNQSYAGERLEKKVERIVNTAEPISDGAPIVFTERKDGVRPEFDIRTDKWDIALTAMDISARENLKKYRGFKNESSQNQEEAKPTHGTESKDVA